VFVEQSDAVRHRFEQLVQVQKLIVEIARVALTFIRHGIQDVWSLNPIVVRA
jgi:hypothetical protein